MSSGYNKEDTNARKKYVFFSDPDVIAQRAEASAAVSKGCLHVPSSCLTLCFYTLFNLFGTAEALSYYSIRRIYITKIIIARDR